MRRLRAIALAVGFVGMSGLASLLVGTGLGPTASAQEEGGSVGGCLAPCDAASTYLADLGYLEGQLSSDQRRCRQQCAQIDQGCRNAVVSATRCYRGSAMAVLFFEGQSCLDLQGTPQRDCRSGVAADTQDLDTFLHNDVQCGQDTCQTAFQACVQSCNPPD